MTYRERVVETTKLACQDIIDRIEELVPDTEGVISTEIHIRIPTMTDKGDYIPTCEIHTEVYSKMRTVERIIEEISEDHEKKPWSEDHGRYYCPYCNSEFDDTLPYACRTPDFHIPKYCPDCGKPILMNQEEQGQEHQV